MVASVMFGLAEIELEYRRERQSFARDGVRMEKPHRSSMKAHTSQSIQSEYRHVATILQIFYSHGFCNDDLVLHCNRLARLPYTQRGAEIVES